MTELRVQQTELTYEGALLSALSAIVDEPGKVASALISHLSHFGVELSDVSVDDGFLEDRGLSCEVPMVNATILLRADRCEIRFSAIDETGDETAAEVVRQTWGALASIAPDVTAKSHSVLLEIDGKPGAGSYRDTLDRFCRPPENLPKGTETAVVYYLPPDGDRGFRDSSFVLNRSAEVNDGVLLAATFVFDGSVFSPDGAIQAGRARMSDVLNRLNVTLLTD